MKSYIHLPKDFEGVRTIEIYKEGNTVVLTEKEFEKIWDKLQDAPLNEWHKKDNE